MFRLYNHFTETRVEVANSGKTMTFYERSELFRKCPKNPVFDHSNYRLFERIPAVPGTSNNRGLTVFYTQPLKYGMRYIFDWTVLTLGERSMV